MKLTSLEYLAIDTETNVPEPADGTAPVDDPSTHEIIEGSALRINVASSREIISATGTALITPTCERPIIRGSIGSTFLCKPPSPISCYASSAHEIRDEDLEGFPGFEAVLPQFMDYTRAQIWVIHNAIFDWTVLQAHAEKMSTAPCEPVLVIDTLPLAQALLPNLRQHKLQVLKHYFKLPRLTAHRATADSATLAMVFHELINVHLANGGKNSVTSLMQVIAMQKAKVEGPMDKITFGVHAGKAFVDLPEDYLTWWLFKKAPMPDGKKGNPRVDLSFATEYYRRTKLHGDLVEKLQRECLRPTPWPTI